MKKIIFLLLLFVSVNAICQDSTKITVSPQARDLEYAGSFIFNSDDFAELYDSIKVKFRIANPPSGNTAVSVTGYTKDWILLMAHLKNDPTALKAGATARIEALLRSVNQPYLTGKLDGFDTADITTFITTRQHGRNKLRRL